MKDYVTLMAQRGLGLTKNQVRDRLLSLKVYARFLFAFTKYYMTKQNNEFYKNVLVKCKYNSARKITLRFQIQKFYSERTLNSKDLLTLN